MVPISKITNQSNNGEVVDIEVDSVHDFYCAGMIAHNCIINDDMNSPKNSNTPEIEAEKNAEIQAVQESALSKEKKEEKIRAIEKKYAMEQIS